MNENERKSAPTASHGWNGSRGTGAGAPPAAQRAKPKPQGSKHGLIAGLLVVLAGVGVWYFVAGNGGDKADRAKTSESGAKKPSKALKEVTPAKAKTNAVKVVEVASAEEQDPSKRILKETYTIRTNGIGKIIERFRTADGKSHMVVGHVQPTFVEPSDQLLAMAMSGRTDGTGAPPPIPGGVSDAQFRESLKTPIVINDDDSDAVKAMKQNVIDARAAMLERLNNGESVDSVLADHHKLAMENDKIRRDCQKELNDIVASGDMEGAKKYQLQMSLALQQMGIAELRMPMTAEEKAELAERRRAAREEAAARRAAREAGK